MLVAFVIITPVGLPDALPAFSSLSLLMAGVLDSVSSSVIPYVTDQLAMARLPRPTFALMLSLLLPAHIIAGVRATLEAKELVDFATLSTEQTLPHGHVEALLR
jgi:inner membrane transporter RhtA